MKKWTAAVMMAILVGASLFPVNAASDIVAVYTPTGSVGGWKDTQTGYMWWTPGTTSPYDGKNRCFSYSGGGWFPQWGVPSVEELQVFFQHGGCTGHTFLHYCYNSDFWSYQTGASSECNHPVTPPAQCAKVVNGQTAKSRWSSQDAYNYTLCIRHTSP